MTLTVFLGTLLVTAFSLAAPSEWIGPQKDSPPAFGEIVAQGDWDPGFPDISFTVVVTGVVQLESHDNDPKCWPDGTLKPGHTYYLNGVPQVVPATTAPCGTEPEDNLYSYTRFDVKPGDLVTGDTQNDSGRLVIRFASESSLLANLGDRVWFDENKNGMQDVDEVSVAGVKVDLFTAEGLFVASDTTDADGLYFFAELPAGGYYVEFTPPEGYSFTQYDADGSGRYAVDSTVNTTVANTGQDDVDSDALVPWVDISVSDGSVIGTAGQPITYTFFHANHDSTLPAANVVLSVTIPIGAHYIVTGSTSGWNCSSAEAGGVCTYTLPLVAANSFGSTVFVTLLDEDEAAMPAMLDLLFGLTQGTLARTQVVTLDAGETDLSVDAGLVLVGASLRTETALEPTNLPSTGQPTAQEFLFLPSIYSEE